MKKHAEMIEGQEAFTRFRNAIRAVLTVPKSAVIESERERKAKPKAKKPDARKG